MNEEIQKNDKSDFRNVELIEKNMTEKEQQKTLLDIERTKYMMVYSD